MDNFSTPTRRSVLMGGGALVASACAPAAVQTARADVAIIGAGLSGLHAARILAAAGASVIVMEAAARPGGRILTLDDAPNRPEAGGSQVGQSYARIRAEAADLGLEIVDPPRGARGRTMAVGDAVFNAAEWPDRPENPLVGDLRAATPDSVLFRLAAPANPLKDVYAWRESASAAHDVSAATFLAQAGLGDEALRMADVALNGGALDSYSMLNLFRTLALYRQDATAGPPQSIAGGASRLTEAMAASLGDKIWYESAVKAVSAQTDGVEVRGDRGVVEADFAILATPFPAVQRIDVDAPMSPLQREAVDGLPYTPIIQIHMTPKTRYWEQDGLPASMWTDGPLERVFALPDRETGETHNLNAWINGTGVTALSVLDDRALSELAIAEMRRVRGVDVDVHRIVRWDQSNALAGGAYMHWAPGQIGRWAADMATPAGRLYFAGEHLSHLHTGMEGAMEAGERAAIAILETSA